MATSSSSPRRRKSAAKAVPAKAEQAPVAPTQKTVPAPAPGPRRVKVQAAISLTWLPDGQIAEVEMTPLIEGSLRSGMLRLVP